MIDARLRMLRVVAERGTISAAAADLGYTPSAVSHQLRTLARDVGVRLLEPEGRNVRLTAGGAHPARATATSCSPGGRRSAGRCSGPATAASLGAAPAGRVLHRGLGPAARRWRPRRGWPSPARSSRSPRPSRRCASSCCWPEQVDLAVVVGHGPAAGDQRRPLRAAPAADRHPGPAGAQRPPPGGRGGGDAGRRRRGGVDHGPPRQALPPARRQPPARRRASRPPTPTGPVEWDTCAALVSAGLGVALIPRLARLPGRVRPRPRGAARPRRPGSSRPHERAAGHLRPARDSGCALTELRRVAASVASPWASDVPPGEPGRLSGGLLVTPRR